MFNRPSSNFNSSKLVHVAAGFQHPVQGSWTLNDDLATVLWTYRLTVPNHFSQRWQYLKVLASVIMTNISQFHQDTVDYKMSAEKSLIVNTIESRLIM